MKYRAFISYKHVSSTVFAENLELAVKAYAKPIWRPPMRVFRDEKYLRPGMDLPRLIRRALTASEYLIYLASPAAAQSAWVQDELEFWCQDDARFENLIVVLTDGRIVADPETKRVDWETTDALPRTLAGRIVAVPFYVDLSWARQPEQQSLLNPDYKKAINGLVAALRDVDPIELSGVEILQHRRNVRIRNTFIASIVTLAIALAIAAVFAWDQMRKAEWRAIYSEAQRLAVDSPNLAARRLAELPEGANVAAAPLAWELINRTPVWASAELRGHGDAIWSLVLAPGGGRLASGGGDGTVRLWDLDDPPAPVELRGHRALVLDIAFSPDGRRVATVSEDDATRLWDAASGELLREIPVGDEQVNRVAFRPAGPGFMTVTYHRVELYAGDGPGVTLAEVPRLRNAAWRPDGTAVTTASVEQGVGAQLHPLDGGAALELAGTAEPGAAALVFSPDGATLAVVCGDGTLRLFDADGTARRTLRQPESGSTPPSEIAARLVAFSPDGARVAAAFGRDLVVWPLGAAGAPWVLHHEQAIEDFDLDADARRVVSVDRGGTALLWRREGSAAPTPVELRGHADVQRVALMADGQHAVTGAGDGSIRLWDFLRPLRPVVTLSGHEGAVESAAFAPDGATVVTASDDGTARLWRAADGDALATLRPQRRGALSGAAFSPDGRTVVLAGDAGAALWRPDGEGEARWLTDEPAAQAAFSTDGRLVIVVGEGRRGGADAAVRLYPAGGDADGGEPAPEVYPGEAAMSRFSPLSADGRRVITFRPDDFLALVYPRGGEAPPVRLVGHENLLLDATFSPDGRRAVTASSDWTIRLWDAVGGELERVMTGAGTEVEMARFSPDGSRILSYSAGHMVRLWDLDGRILRKVQADGAPGPVAFSADGGAILIVENGFGGYRAVRVVDSGPEGTSILLSDHAGRILDAAFSADGRRLVSASADRTAKVYALGWPALRETLRTRSPRIYDAVEEEHGR